MVETATDQIGNCLGTALDLPGGARMIYTGSGTEANNLILRGLTASRFILSKIEHPSVLAVGKWLEIQGKKVDWVQVNRSGEVCLENLSELLKHDNREPTLVSIMWANNETGVIQPIDEVALLCRQNNAKFHVDATQCVGKIPIQLDTSCLSSISFSAHKFHGPPGVGALWLAPGE